MGERLRGLFQLYLKIMIIILQARKGAHIRGLLALTERADLVLMFEHVC